MGQASQNTLAGGSAAKDSGSANISSSKFGKYRGSHTIYDPESEVRIQLASAQAPKGGAFHEIKLNLLENVTGVPCQLKEIKTAKDTKAFFNTYLQSTLDRYGLSMLYVRAWIFLADGPATSPAVRWVLAGQDSNATEWDSMLRTLTEAADRPCRHHSEPKCNKCTKPSIQACLDEDHVHTALSSRGLRPDTPIMFLDYANSALAAKHEASPPTLKQALFAMNLEATQSLNHNALQIPPPPQLYPVIVSENMIGSFTIFNGIQLEQLGAQVDPASQGSIRGPVYSLRARMCQVAGRYVVYLQPLQHDVLLPGNLNLAFHLQPLAQPSMPEDFRLGRVSRDEQYAAKAAKRSAPQLSPPIEAKRPRQVNAEAPTRKLAHLTVPDWKWDEAALRPVGNTKAENDTCLTCIHFKRTCHGTELIDGKCQVCSKSPKKGHGGRKCYWSDPPNGVRTYHDAKNADPQGRWLPQNSREGLANRAEGKLAAHEQSVSAPASDLTMAHAERELTGPERVINTGAKECHIRPEFSAKQPVAERRDDPEEKVELVGSSFESSGELSGNLSKSVEMFESVEDGSSVAETSSGGL